PPFCAALRRLRLCVLQAVEFSELMTVLHRTGKRVRALGAALLVAAFALVACGSDNDDLAQRASNDGTNYVAGDGSVEELGAESRGDAVEVDSQLFDGTEITPETFQGEVSVINFWYAACAPCRVEAPDLQETYEEFESDGVQFFGLELL